MPSFMIGIAVSRLFVGFYGDAVIFKIVNLPQGKPIRQGIGAEAGPGREQETASRDETDDGQHDCPRAEAAVAGRAPGERTAET
jgi:hypothetical protein